MEEGEARLEKEPAGGDDEEMDGDLQLKFPALFLEGYHAQNISTIIIRNSQHVQASVSTGIHKGNLEEDASGPTINSSNPMPAMIPPINMMKASIRLLGVLHPDDLRALACCSKAGQKLMGWMKELHSSAVTLQSLARMRQGKRIQSSKLRQAIAIRLLQRVYRGYVYGRKPRHALALFRARQKALGKEEAEVIKFLEDSIRSIMHSPCSGVEGR